MTNKTGASVSFRASPWPDGSTRYGASFAVEGGPLRLSATAGLLSPQEALSWALYNINECEVCYDAPIHWYGGCDCECHGGMFLRGVLVRADRISQ